MKTGDLVVIDNPKNRDPAFKGQLCTIMKNTGRNSYLVRFKTPVNMKESIGTAITYSFNKSELSKVTRKAIHE